MKRRKHVSEEDLLGCNTQSSTSMNGRENTEPIPNDLIFEVLLRLPTKAIARCRCVSKIWASILCRHDFTELFFTRSSDQPQLLFSYENKGELLIFSAPQVPNPNENSSPLAATCLMKFPTNGTTLISGHVRGLLCVMHVRKGRNGLEICNPSTQQSLPLPNVKPRLFLTRSFFVYDPIGKQFKVLSISWPLHQQGRISGEHQILTLGTRKLSWRMIDCTIRRHYPVDDGICIDGCLYYEARFEGVSGNSTIVCFDVRSEKFRIIEKANGVLPCYQTVLVNHKGKLGLLKYDHGERKVSRFTACIVLWVLVDAGKHEWLKHKYTFPSSSLRNVVAANACLYYVGMTSTNEVLLSPRNLSHGLYVLYYNLERNTIVRVDIQGMDVFNRSQVRMFLHHVEDVKLYANVHDFVIESL